MSTTLAIDPGCFESAYVIVIDANRCPLEIDKLPNEKLIDRLANLPTTHYNLGQVAIEEVVSYGMPVGREIFETVHWAGRMYQILAEQGYMPQRIGRQKVKLHHCHSSKANDGNVRQALVDRFAPGQPNHGKGTAANPGWFYGFRADIWQAYALAVHTVDLTRLDALA